MAIERSIPSVVRDDLEQADGEHALIAFLRIEHPSLPDDMRFVCDLFDYEWDGHLWTGLVFEFVLLNDDDEMPEAHLAIPNVDRKIGKAIRALALRPKISLYMLSAADFDLDEDPRVATGTPEKIYSFVQYDLLNVEGQTPSITGRVALREYGQEPWPGIRATKSRCPGLFT